MDPGQTASQCLSDDVLARLDEGLLSLEELAQVRAHAEGCSACNDLVIRILGPSSEAPAAVPPAPPGPPGPPGPPPSPDWSPPTSFGVFRLGEELGRGAMGVVYQAQNVAVRREVALKFIASSQSGARVREYFQNEAIILASFAHANIVTLYSTGEVDGHPYIETEYVKGQSLSDLARPLPWTRVLELGIGLSRGLAAAHRKKVLHRDIKPSNAISTEDGGVKLLDFGIAEQLEAGSSAGSGGGAGTLLYMSPEVLDGAPSTERSDLYSLGVVLYELCTEQVPNADARLGPGVDPVFAGHIERCIRSDPEKRFASADLLVRALESIRARVPDKPADNPYPGLAPFEEEHQAYFHGRNADIRVVMERLRRQPLVLVAAESGTGKSSLCRAGVLPRVMAGQLVEGRPFNARILVPGRQPLETLAAALAPILVTSEAELFTAAADEPERLGERLRERHGSGAGLLLFVDQLEELVTLSDPGQAVCFARFLGVLARRPSPGVRVLLAARGDFLTRLAPLLGKDLVERGFCVLGPMTPEGLREAIVAPAHAFGVSFESEALIRHLVESAGQGTGGLPLLSFALAELFERRDKAGARITQAALEAMGGVAGLLSRHADGVLARLSAGQARQARRLLIRLTTNERTRIERSRDELDVTSEDGRIALNALVEGRLLQTRVQEEQVYYQIAHDSLIQSWDLLRSWLDDDVGHRALRQRLEEAAREWERVGCPQDMLWTQRQVDEARLLDLDTLGDRQLEFLQSSRRLLRSRRRLRRAGIAAVPVLLASLYLTFQLLQWREARDYVRERMGEAERHSLEASSAGRAACARRKEALVMFTFPGSASGAPEGPAGDAAGWESAERFWDLVLEDYKQADVAYGRAEQALQSALDRSYGRDQVRKALADVVYRRLEMEECFHPQGAGAPEVQRLLNRFEDQSWKERVRIPAMLDISTEPPGAAVEIERYVDSGGALVPEPVRVSAGPTPISRLSLPPGSYRLRFAAPGHAQVMLPVLLTRGEPQRLKVALPASVPDGYAYVPPGCSLLGSDNEVMRRDFLVSSPLHRVCFQQGYLIGKTEITFGDWLKYLDTLPPDAPARHVLETLRQTAAGGISLRRQPVAGWVLSFYRSGARILTAWEGEDYRYQARERRSAGDWRQFPLSGISVVDLEGYFAWLDRSGRLPGARLCTEEEWERAARGADARSYPGGERLSQNDANIDLTYGRNPNAFGPDVVGSYPASASPFGVLDMAGNALEMTLVRSRESRRIVLKGGGWYYSGRNALSATRVPGEPSMRDATIGARACADYPPPDERAGEGE